MPLSFAALLGGRGHGDRHLDQHRRFGPVGERRPAPIGFFEITGVGLPIALVGGVLLVLLAPRLLEVAGR